MIDPLSATQITWHFSFDASRHEYRQSHELVFACKVLELRLKQRLRFEKSSVYSMSVHLDFATHASPEPTKPAASSLVVCFNSEVGRDAELTELARQELRELLVRGPRDVDLISAREISVREHEDASQTSARPTALSNRAAHALSPSSGAHVTRLTSGPLRCRQTNTGSRGSSPR